MIGKMSTYPKLHACCDENKRLYPLGPFTLFPNPTPSVWLKDNGEYLTEKKIFWDCGETGQCCIFKHLQYNLPNQKLKPSEKMRNDFHEK